MPHLLISCFLFVFAAAQVIPPTHPNIFYTGRTQAAGSSDGGASIVFDWPGVQFEFYFNGSSVALLLQELMPTQYPLLPLPPLPPPPTSPLFFSPFPLLLLPSLTSDIFFNENSGSWLNVILDGHLVNIITLTSSNDSYTVVSGIKDDNLHHLVITKRTEPLVGIVSFSGVIFPSGGSIHPPPTPLPTRKIEFIGDSITCGFGNQGLAGCQFTPPTENNLLTYEQIIGSQLEAQVFVEAWSGKGVIRNCCNQNITTPNPLPSYYGLSIANYPTSHWDFSSWVPDAVVINLGTNDYSTAPQPPEDLFVTAYVNFIQEIRQNYQPATPNIFLVCGPMIGDPCCQYVQAVAQKITATYIDLRNILTNPYDYGCDGHPSVSGHYKMAETALPIIQKTMAW